MNTSLLPLYGATILSRRMRSAAAWLEDRAGVVEARRALTGTQRDVLQRNAVFRDKHKGRAAYVIVNGPSLAQQDISGLGEHITFVVSGFWKHEAVLKWQPNYYSLLDSNFFTDTPATQAFYASMHERIHASTFFVPLYRGFDAVQQRRILPADRTFFIASMGNTVVSNDLTSIVQSFQGVSAFALAQAVYMGCNPIGFDHDYLANRGVDRHFYTGGTIPGHQATNVPLADRVPYDEEMRANTKLWTNYRMLKTVAERQNIQIFNATEGGYLDVFPRAPFNVATATA